MARVLVVVAVPAEAAAVLGDTPARPVRLGPYEAHLVGERVAGELTVLAGGVGPARAAAAAGTALGLERFDLVLSAGVGGGFAGRAGPGDLVLADRVVHADLGAELAGGLPAGGPRSASGRRPPIWTRRWSRGPRRSPARWSARC